MVYEAADTCFRPHTPEETQTTLERYGLTYNRYILSVGALEPRKNYVRLIEAYAILHARYAPAAHLPPEHPPLPIIRCMKVRAAAAGSARLRCTGGCVTRSVAARMWLATPGCTAIRYRWQRVSLLLPMWGTRFSQTVSSANWPREQALEYIRSQAGKHFDPKVVELFLKVIGAEPDTAD